MLNKVINDDLQIEDRKNKITITTNSLIVAKEEEPT